METSSQKIVRFDVYCRTCKFKDLREDEDPCDYCLANPVNTNSHKPVKYKEKEESK